MRDTSSQFQPQYVEPEPVKPVEEKSSKKSKKSKKTETVANPVPFTNQSSEGFQMKHDPTNQCDYF
jgi:hypothetical protein